jgi:dihydrofolate synthase/folylpolyglutamate synthase
MTNAAYDRCLKEMYGLRRFGIKLEMDTIQHLLRNLGNPQEAYRSIHIAGTNGKGSIASILSSILHTAGFCVGRYTSPHLVKFNERICINDKPISDQEVVQAYQRVNSVDPPLRHPTFFEFTTAMALDIFARRKVDWAVIETGMGGRMDATNIIQSAVSIITNISLEHKTYLGRTIAAITTEKAGIIKSKIPVVTGVRQKSAWEVICAVAAGKKAPVYRMGRDFSIRRQQAHTFTYKGMQETWRNLSIGLHGDHQLQNAALALAACELLLQKGLASIDGISIQSGLKQAVWPGRLEVVLTAPMLILDGAHNLMAARFLAKYLKQNLHDKHLTLVIGILDDKPYKQMLADLTVGCQRIIITQPAIDRAVPAAVLAKEARKIHNNVEVISDVGQAVKQAISQSRPNDVICVAGSLYAVGEARAALSDTEQTLLV